MRKFLAVMLFAAAGSAGAATFTVNSNVDAFDAAPGDGICATSTGDCPLRAAVHESNHLPGRDRIEVPAGTWSTFYTMQVGSDVEIVGAGAGSTVMDIDFQANAPLELVAMTLAKHAGADQGPLTLRHCVSTASVSATVGPPPLRRGSLRVYNSRLKGIGATYSVVSLADSIVENGSVSLRESALFVERSTFISSPITTRHETTASRSDIILINSTFTGAATTITGAQPLDVFDVNYCTFADGARLFGGGAGEVIVSNTIIKNTAAGTSACSAIANFRSLGNNVISDASGSCNSAFNKPTDKVNTDPLLGPLTTEAGKPVYPLLPGSPAIDSGGALVRVDERGVGRPQGGAADVGAYEACSACAAPTRRARGDFNLDGRSDILWRYLANDKLAVWLMNGPTVLSGQYIENTVAGAGDFIGDWDGDGDADLANPIDLMENTVVRFYDPVDRSRVFVPGVPLGGTLLATADFDGDGREDWLMRNAGDGTIYINLMAGRFGMPLAVAVPAAEWQFVAAKDFDGDGRADITWRNTNTHGVVLWRMRDWAIAATVNLASPPPQWQFLAAGDFTGDGRADLLWRHGVSSDIAQWQFDSSGALDSALIIAQTPQPWNVRMVGKLNDDDTDDLVWRQDGSGGNGDNAAWLMQPGGGILSSQYLVDVESLDWVVLGPR